VCIDQSQILSENLGVESVGMHLVCPEVDSPSQAFGDGFIGTPAPFLQLIGVKKVFNDDESVGAVEFNLFVR
jgi:hypothetical protein